MDQDRTPKQILIIGTNGTGKSTMAKKLVLAELKKPDTHVLIVVPDDMEWPTVEFVHSKFTERIRNYVGARKIIYFDGLLPIISENFKNGLLVFDDCRAYFTASLDKDLHTLLIRRRQKMIDILAVGHGFTEIPPKMFTFSTHIILFNTLDAIKKRRDSIRNYEEMEQAQTRVNQKALKDPHVYEILKTV